MNEPQGDLTESQWAQIEKSADEFAKDLRAGRQPEIENHLNRIDTSLRSKLREELFGETFEHRYGHSPRYRPIAELGRGNFGVVYKAWDTQLDRHVALKVLERTELEAKSRFLVEARRQATLPKHQHLVILHDVGELPRGNPFLAMEYIDGGTLRRKLASEGALTEEVAARLIEQVALAVVAVHTGTRRQLVHQDLKPENILIDCNGRAHVADFGLAAAVFDLHAGAPGVGGTPKYMSPEQVRRSFQGQNDSVDARSDVWALGVMLYELLTGVQPFDSKKADLKSNRDDIIEAILRYEPPDHISNVSPELQKLIIHCLRKDRAERLASASEVAKRLRAWLDSVKATPTAIDFSSLIGEKLTNYCARPWLSDEVDAWHIHRDESLLLIAADLGCGKSAFIADLVRHNFLDDHITPKPNGQIIAYHFCDVGRNETLQPARFIQNIAGMLAQHFPEYRAKLADPALRKVLNETCEIDPASAYEAAIVAPLHECKAPDDGVRYILIDGLDESLHVPRTKCDPTIADIVATCIRPGKLPSWVRIIATTRRKSEVLRRYSGARHIFIDGKNRDGEESKEHAETFRADLADLIEARLDTPNLAERLAQARLAREDVIKTLLAKKGVNQLYLTEVFRRIELGDKLEFTDLAELPPGLERLFDKFFARDFPTKESFSDARVVLQVVLAAQEPPTEELLSATTGLDADDKLPEVFDKLADYLYAVEHRGVIGCRLRQQFVAEWLADKKRAGKWYVDENKGHKKLGDYWPDSPNGHGRDYVLRFGMTHLVSVRDRAMVTHRIFDTCWVYERLCQEVVRHESFSGFCGDLRLAIPFLGDRAKQVHQLRIFVLYWETKIKEIPGLFDQWWDAAGDVTHAFPRPERFPDADQEKPTLLAPIVGPGVNGRQYRTPWPATPEFHPAVCEVMDGDRSRLVFATADRRLLIYRDDGTGYVPEPPPIQFLVEIDLLAALPYPYIAAAVRLVEGDADLRVIDISTGAVSDTLFQCPDITALVALQGRSPRLLVASPLVADGAASERGAVELLCIPPVLLRVLNSDGAAIAETTLPFQPLVTLVPFAADTWAIRAIPDRSAPSELLLLRLDESLRKIREIPMPRLRNIVGACAIGDNRLAVTYRSMDRTTSALAIVCADGTIACEISLHSGPAAPRNRPSYGEQREQSLLDVSPVGWHDRLGVVLYSHAQEGRMWSVQPEHEAIPCNLSGLLNLNADYMRVQRSLGISDNRILFVSSNGAIVLGPGATDVSLIEAIDRPRITTEIRGCQSDGNVVVCDRYTDPNNKWSRDNYRLAVAPFGASTPPSDNRADAHHVSRDGWEMGQASGGDILELRRGGTCDPPIRLRRGSENAEIICACENLAVVKLGSEHFVADVLMGRRFRFQREVWGNAMSVLAFTENAALILAQVSRGVEGERCYLYSAHAERPFKRQKGVQLSTSSFLRKQGKVSGDWWLDVVEIVGPARQSMRNLRKMDWADLPADLQNRFSSMEELETVLSLNFVGETRDSLELIDLCCNIEHQTVEPRGVPRLIKLAGNVVQWIRSGQHLVLGYETGRIEIRPLDRLTEVVAAGYTASRPDGMIVTARPEGTFLVVTAGELVWFDISQFA